MTSLATATCSRDFEMALGKQIRIGCAGLQGDSGRGERLFRRRDEPSRTLRDAVLGGRNQQLVLSTASSGNVRALGPIGRRRVRFAVKILRRITHELRLTSAKAEFVEFLAGPLALGAKLGPLLVQLPPSLRFDATTAERFFRMARKSTAVPIVCEPRHRTWFEPAVEDLFRRHSIRAAGRRRSVLRAGGCGAGRRRIAHLLPTARVAEGLLLNLRRCFSPATRRDAR